MISFSVVSINSKKKKNCLKRRKIREKKKEIPKFQTPQIKTKQKKLKQFGNPEKKKIRLGK